MHWLKFKDKLSDDMGLVTVDIGRRQKAEEQTDSYEIPYRNDELIIHSQTYKPYIREMELATTDRTKFSIINQWLDGRGQLRTSMDEGGYFVASVVTGLEFEQMVNNVDSFQVGFKCNPFFYLDSGDEAMTITSSTTIYNPGTIYSDPYIKIVGSGNVDLTINDMIYSFTNIADYIEVNSELKIAYKDTLNQGEKMVGEFPILQVGENAISWTGTVTSIEITPKWREL